MREKFWSLITGALLLVLTGLPSVAELSQTMATCVHGPPAPVLPGVGSQSLYLLL